MITIESRVAAARQTLREAGLRPDEALASARVLAEFALGWTTTQYLMSAGETEPAGFADHYGSLVARRAAREPSAYIIGRKEFWGLSLEVSPAVLIPRPDTELLVEAALEAIGPRRGDPLRIADAGTGSGCVAIALARELPAATCVATDISEAALEIARRNASRLGVADRIQFVAANVLKGVEGQFDLIAANPPYVKQGDRPALQPEVREYEPAVALFGGITGIDVVGDFVGQAVPLLKPGGHLIFEFGLGQDVEVEELIAAHGLSMIGLRRDVQGIARTAVTQKVQS